MDLIRALTEAALERGYLDVQPANDAAPALARTERAELPPVDRAA